MATAKRHDEKLENRDLNDLCVGLKEARANDEPLIIELDSAEGIAITPRPRRRAERLTKVERAKADEVAFLSSAGSWKGQIDAAEFTKQYRAARGSRRPFVEISLPDE